MNTLTYNQIVAAASHCGNGRIVRIGYKKEQELFRGWKELGFRVFKLTDMSVRLGVRYDKIAKVLQRRGDAERSENKTTNWIWVLPNKVKYNTNTDKTYLQVATLNRGHNTKSQYLVYDGKQWALFDKETFEMSEYATMLKVQVKHSSAVPEVLTISFDNIYKLGDVVA